MPKSDYKWPDRFVSSLSNWAKMKDTFKDSTDPIRFLGSVDKAVENSLEKDSEENELFIFALRAMMHQRIDCTFREIEQAWGRCKSPIEYPLLFALTIVGRELGWSVIFKNDPCLDGDREDIALENLTIEAQAKLGNYQVDFLLTLRTIAPDFDHPTKAPDGREIPGTKEIEKKMIIECDGHDYHERTKEQARRDKSRDRWLQSFGYLVFRYTGQEIFDDVFKCAHGALTALGTLAEKDSWK